MKFVLLIAVFVSFNQLAVGSEWQSFDAEERPEGADELKKFRNATRNARIENGSQASKGQFPFSVIVDTLYSNNDWFYCSGSLIRYFEIEVFLQLTGLINNNIYTFHSLATNMYWDQLDVLLEVKWLAMLFLDTAGEILN